MTFVLTYHEVAPVEAQDRSGFPGPSAARYKLDPARFEAHLDAVAAAGVSVGLLPGDPQAALTFDDGGSSALIAAEALEQRGWRGHFFIVTGRVGTPGFLSADELIDLARRGHQLGSHSDSHPTYMGALDRQALATEWRRSRDILGEILGTAPRTAAVPGGFLSASVIGEAARAGYQLLMTSQPTAKRKWYGDLLVHGRFTIWATTTPARAAGYARGDRLARASLWLGWEAKSAPKRLSPRAYEVVRQGWARRRHPR